MTESELQNIASAFQLIGQILFASAVVDPAVAGNSSFKGLILGGIAAMILFISSFLIVHLGKQDSQAI